MWRLCGTRLKCPPVRAAVDLHTLFFYIYFLCVSFCFCLLACCYKCCSHNFLWIKHSNLYQAHFLSSPLLSCPLLILFCLSPGFSGVPEDLLPDFDLKIMPGRGIMHASPHLVPFIHTNPTYCSHMGVGTIWMVVVGIPWGKINVEFSTIFNGSYTYSWYCLTSILILPLFI